MNTKQWNLILPQAVEHFATHVKETREISPDHYDKNSDEWLKLNTPNEMYEYIIADEYWVREWANFLFATLIHVLYQQSPYKFKR
jgi:hypothetical protein